MKTLIGSQDSEILWVIEQIYRDVYAVAPSVFTHTQQEDCMRGLLWDLPRCMARVGLHSERGQLSYLQEARDAPKAWLKEIGPMKWNGRMDSPD